MEKFTKEEIEVIGSILYNIPIGNLGDKAELVISILEKCTKVMES